MKIAGKFLSNSKVTSVIFLAIVMMSVSQMTFAQDRWSVEFPKEAIFRAGKWSLKNF